MSPCTAKINAFRNKHASKYVLPFHFRTNIADLLTNHHHRAKPKSLFAQASAKKLQADNPLGATNAPSRAFQL